MRARIWLLWTQICICVALGVSAALYLHYLNPADSDFCGLRAGCEAARKTPFAYFGTRYVSLPLFSLLAWSTLLGLSLRRGRERPRALARGGAAALWELPELTLFAGMGLGAVIAVGLIGYQAFVLREYCWLCLIVDGSALLGAFGALGWAVTARGEQVLPHSPLRSGAWVAIALVMLLAPALWTVVRPPKPVPDRIRALYQPGKINVVEFADFECPYCRRLHLALRPLLAEYGDRAAFRRLHLPLAQHQHAEGAARAALCAEAQGRGEEMADRLFRIELAPETVSAAAEALLLDPLRFDACIDAPATTAALERDRSFMPEDQFEGLPMTYIGNEALLGVPTDIKLRDALERAARPARPSLSAAVYLLLVAAVLGLCSWFGRAEPPVPARPEPG